MLNPTLRVSDLRASKVASASLLHPVSAFHKRFNCVSAPSNQNEQQAVARRANDACVSVCVCVCVCVSEREKEFFIPLT